MRLVFAIKLYLMNRGLVALGRRLNVEALARPGAQERNLARCRGLFNAGQACCFMGRYEEAAEYLNESAAIAREIADRGRIAAALELLGMVSLARGELPTARSHLAEGLSLAEQYGTKRELAAATNALAQLHRVEGSLDTAETLYETVIGLSRELGDREIIAIGMLNLAIVWICRRSEERARDLLLEVLRIAEEIGSKPMGVSLLEVSAGLMALRGDWLHVAILFGAAEAQTMYTGMRADPADEAFLKPLIANARRTLGEQTFADGEATGRALTYERALAKVRLLLKDDARLTA